MKEKIIKIELEDELDLHHFHPKDARDVLKDFIDMSVTKGKNKIRVAHGKGKSTIKGIVIKELEKNRHVVSFKDEPGNWGATIVILKKESTDFK